MLDIGYSKGSFADYFLESGWDCTALDINPHKNSKITMIKCDILNGLPVDTEAYDVVTAGEIIEHVLDEGAFLDECHRVLKPNGKLLLTTPNLAYLVNRFLVFAGYMPKFVYEPYHYHFHIKQTLCSLIKQHGFTVDHITSSHILYSTRRHFSGKLFEYMGDIFPTLGAHLILLATRTN